LDYGFNRLIFHAPGHNQLRLLELFQWDLDCGHRARGEANPVAAIAGTQLRISLWFGRPAAHLVSPSGSFSVAPAIVSFLRDRRQHGRAELVQAVRSCVKLFVAVQAVAARSPMPSKHRLRPKLPMQQFKPRLEQRFKRVNIFR